MLDIQQNMQNMHKLCKKYAKKYTKNIQKICKKYANKSSNNMLNM